MSGFSSDWLDLRESTDLRARSPELRDAFVAALPDAAHILDLGSGTGATLRALAPHLPLGARLTLVDHDAALLEEARLRHPQAEIRRADLADALEAQIAENADAITCSALLDLVSEAWADRPVHGLDGRIFYAALTYDGSEDWTPPHPADTAVLAAFQAHQRRDKGFGPAMGGAAVTYLEERLREIGYSVHLSPSPWELRSPQDAPLIAALAEGIATAAKEAGCPDAFADEWRAARRAALACGIGHLDLLAMPKV